MSEYRLLPYQEKHLETVLWYLTDTEGNHSWDNEYLSPGYKEQYDIPKNIGTGRTEVLAVAYLKIAIANPNKEVFPRDITNAFNLHTFIKDKYLLERIIILWNEHFKNEKTNLVFKKTNMSIQVIEKK